MKSKSNINISSSTRLRLHLLMCLTLVMVMSYNIQMNRSLTVSAITEDNINITSGDTSIEGNTVDEVEDDVIVIEKVVTVEKKVEVTKEVNPFKLKDLGVFKVTAYCPCRLCCGKWAESPRVKITSIGAGAYEGVTIAVDPSIIPYGTKLYSNEFGVRIATDCGGAIKGNRLDLYFSSHEKALEFGVKNVRLFSVTE